MPVKCGLGNPQPQYFKGKRRKAEAGRFQAMEQWNGGMIGFVDSAPLRSCARNLLFRVLAGHFLTFLGTFRHFPPVLGRFYGIFRHFSRVDYQRQFMRILALFAIFRGEFIFDGINRIHRIPEQPSAQSRFAQGFAGHVRGFLSFSSS